MQRGSLPEDLSLGEYQIIHGPHFYWTLSKGAEAIVIFMPIADDVSSCDVVYDCRGSKLRFGLVSEKGGIVIDDKVLYDVDGEESRLLIDKGVFGERCVVLWLLRQGPELSEVTDRFLLEGEKKRDSLSFNVTHKVFMDIEIEQASAGRLVLGLFGDVAPRTVENFRCLCTGEKGTSEDTGHPLHYKGTRFHRVIPGFCIQGGQTFESDDGDGGESIYGSFFADENLRVKFKQSGLLAMANGGPDQNGSQFFITIDKADHLSSRCVAFGQVLDGWDVVKAVEAVGGEDAEPTQRVVISDCGELAMTQGEASLQGEQRQRA